MRAHFCRYSKTGGNSGPVLTLYVNRSLVNKSNFDLPIMSAFPNCCFIYFDLLRAHHSFPAEGYNVHSWAQFKGAFLFKAGVHLKPVFPPLNLV